MEAGDVLPQWGELFGLLGAGKTSEGPRACLPCNAAKTNLDTEGSAWGLKTLFDRAARKD